jgi:ArsR family transcriptional regulator, arsenate/arsenite/antimonite-responsive transcriptional repressor
MALNFSDKFSTHDVSVARMCKALSHPARIAIMRILAERNSCVCGELVTTLPLAQATISQHLKELKEAGLIRGDVDGPRVCYCIDPKGWKKAQKFFIELSTMETCC